MFGAACASVRTVDPPVVRGRIQPLTSPSTEREGAGTVVVSPVAPTGPRSALLDLLRGIQRDFGTTLTARHLATRLDAPARSSESLGAWVLEPAGLPIVIDADAMSIDSPVDWLRVSIHADLAIHLDDLTRLFSTDYSVTRRAELVAVEFRSPRRMCVRAELRTEGPTNLSSSRVIAVQVRRPSYDPSFARLQPEPVR